MMKAENGGIERIVAAVILIAVGVAIALMVTRLSGSGTELTKGVVNVVPGMHGGAMTVTP